MKIGLKSIQLTGQWLHTTTIRHFNLLTRYMHKIISYNLVDDGEYRNHCNLNLLLKYIKKLPLKIFFILKDLSLIF